MRQQIATTSRIRDVLRRVEQGSARVQDITVLESVAAQVSPLLSSETTALCDFGPAFAWTMQGFLRAFGEEFAQYVEVGGTILW